MKKFRDIFFLVTLAAIWSFPAANALEPACPANPKLQEQRSQELQLLYSADQADRAELMAHMDQAWSKDKMEQLEKNDRERRRRVAEIFADGCMKSAADYAAAAMVYQHGVVPDHYYQTFIWSQRAVELGDARQVSLMALAIDRYLVNVGKKQLFGSQAHKVNPEDACWCLQDIEKSFPDSLRKKYAGKTKREAAEWVKSINGKNHCPVTECKEELKATPRGSVPGFW